MKIYFKPSVWLTIFAFPSFLILIILGSWQVQRLSWKSDLISNYNNNFQQAPITVKELFKDKSNFSQVIADNLGLSKRNFKTQANKLAVNA